MVPKSAVDIDGTSRPSVALSFRDSRLLIGDGLGLDGLGDKIRILIDTGPCGFLILDSKIARIIMYTSKLLDHKGSHL
jgi:predicted aspartyl protease